MADVLNDVSKVCSDTTEVLDDITRECSGNHEARRIARVCSDMTKMMSDITSVYNKFRQMS